MSPGSLSFAKLVMMSSAPAKSTGDARYASQDPFIQSTLFHTISTPICIRNVFSSLFLFIYFLFLFLFLVTKHYFTSNTILQILH